MANKSEFNNNKHNSNPDVNSQEETSLSENSKAKAASLMEFISNIKEHFDNIETEATANALKENKNNAENSNKVLENNELTEDLLTGASSKINDNNDDKINETGEKTVSEDQPAQKLTQQENVSLSSKISEEDVDALVQAADKATESIADQSEEVSSKAEESDVNEINADEETKEETVSKEENLDIDLVTNTEETDIAQKTEDNSNSKEIPLENKFADSEPILKENEHKATSEENQIDEEAFNTGFNPSFAFYDDDDEALKTASDPIFEDDDAPLQKTFERKGAKPEITAAEKIQHTDNKEGSANKSKIISVSGKIKEAQKNNKALAKKQNDNLKVKGNKNKFKNPFAGMPRKIVAAVIAVVFVIGGIAAGGVFAAKGLIPALASDDIYGIFVNGNLVAASNQQGKIEEAIDDFLAHYKTLEEQGSLTNLRFTSPYEIRELTRDEIKENIYTEKKTTKPVEEQVNEQGGEQQPEETFATVEETSKETTAEQTTTQAQDGESTTHATAIQLNPLNKYENKITVSKNINELKTVLFYGSSPKTYSVVEGDNLYKIAKRENLTLTELMVPNPDLLEDSTIGIDQDILIVKMSGPMKLSFSREVTYTEDIAFKTIEEKTDELYVGETKTTQQGKEGIRQEITKYDYENNVIAVKTPISDDTIEEPVNKVVKVGTKEKESPEQKSEQTDATNQSQPAETSGSGYRWPVTGARISSQFGRRKSPKRGASSYHRGVDLAIASGTPIYAAQSGTVTISSYSGGYGNLVEINHGGGMTTRYGHCLSLKVKRGQKVQKGDLIALVGSTGVSTGPHLHFEVRKNGSAVNPLNYLN